MLKEERLSYVIRGCVYEVFKHLGGGFLEKVHEAQVLNYLKATDTKVGMLVNFAYPRATIKRLVL